MNEAKRAGEGPIAVKLEAGKTYFWCTCGQSSSQPFCDGKHKDSEFTPQSFVAEKDGNHWLCACKATANGPFCDGAHTK